MQPTTRCRVCGQVIDEHFELFDHIRCERPVAEPEPTPWQLEKQMNRMERTAEKLDQRQLPPHAVKAVQETYALIHEGRNLIREVQR